MKVNMGNADRAVRGIVGISLLGAAVTGTLGPWAYVGVVPMLTAAVGVCPLYSVFGFSTCPVRKS